MKPTWVCGSATRVVLTAGAGVLALWLGGCSNQSADTPVSLRGALDKPNVVLIIADTLRADAMGVYGEELATSPELDVLAGEGATFDWVVAPSSWTKPSTAALLTGKYPRSVGMYREEGEILAEAYTTWAEVLKAEGYTTMGITSNPSLNSVFNYHQGFDDYTDSTVRFNWMEDASEENKYYQNKLMPAREIFEETLLFVRRAPEGPYFIQLNVMEMHEYRRGGGALTRREYRNSFSGLSKQRGNYYDALRQLSFDVNTFVRDFSSIQGCENTLFVFTSDHGEGLDSHGDMPGSKLHGMLLYESMIRVPLILWHPSQPQALRGKRVSHPVRLIDVFPTVMDLVGLSWPKEMDGVSVLPFLNDGKTEIDLPAYFVTETYFKRFEKIGLYGREWKYFENRDEWQVAAPRELQRIGLMEQGESTNALADHPEIAARMEAYLAQWEERHPKVPPTLQTEELSEEEEQQLRDIGYLN